MSIAGGLHRAFYRGRDLGCDCLQIFVKNQRQWSARPLGAQDIRLWERARRQTRLEPVLAHAGYLINLACPDARIRRRSIHALIDEANRCEQLGIRELIVHPGSHRGAGRDAGLARVIAGLDEVLERTSRGSVRIVLETTAGQGSSLGGRFEDLAEILAAVAAPERIGVCLDTCHIHAAGYDLTSPQGYHQTLAQLDALVGLERVVCIHMNDSKTPRGSRVDRHEHIGKGTIGHAGFARLVQDARLAHVPKILETPKGFDRRGCAYDKRNLACLRRMASKRA